MALPDRTQLDAPQTWSLFKGWLQSEWDHINGLPADYIARDTAVKLDLEAQLAAFLATVNYRGQWLTATAYSASARDYVLQGGLYYLCTVSHTSGTFATDLAALKWVQLDATALFAALASTGPGQGSEMVAYLPPGTGAVATTLAKKAQEYVSSYDKLTAADIVQVLAGTATDNTTAIQNLLTDGGVIFIDKGTYVVNPLTMVSNTVLWMHPEAKLLAKTGYGTNDRLLTISNCDNVTIHGNHATIQMLKAEYLTDEQRHCVNLTGGSTNVSIYDLHCIDSGGDGFYVGGTAPVENILLMNCYADNNRRQGLSITNVIGCKVIGGEYKNTIGTLPESGIDIEPNPTTGYYIQDVLLQGVRTTGNNGPGITVTPTHLDTPITVTIRDCVSSDSEGLNSSSSAMFITTSATGTTGKIRGKITVDNCKIINPAKNGFCVGSWSEYAPELEFIDCYVLNPAYDWASASASVTFQNGFRNVTASGDTTGSSFGYYKIRNFVVEDDRATVLTYMPVYITNAGAAAPLTDIEIDRVKWIGATAWVSTALTPVFLSSTLIDNVTVNYGYNYLVQSDSTIFPDYMNGAIVFSPGSSTYTLPLAADNLGAEFGAYVKNAGTTTLTPNAVDVIDIYSGGVAGNAAVSSTVGSFLKVKAIEAGRWAIQNVVGTWA